MEGTKPMAMGSLGGASLDVPIVQELVKTPMNEVPPRYVRTDLPDLGLVDSSIQVPVIDLKRLAAPSDDFAAAVELSKFDKACKEWGFFQLINHGVGISLLDTVKKEVTGFFKMPMEEKKKYLQHGDIQGYGQHFVKSEEQKLDWGDLLYLIMLPVHMRNNRGLFSELPPALRESLERYSDELKKLALFMLDCIAKALNMKADEMRDLYEGARQGMRMNYYPPCPQPDVAIGLTPHSDASALTILLQINEVEGLHIKKDRRWIAVKPLPNAFIVNIGDTLEILTNGMYNSVEHRAVVNSEKERLSIATFHGARLDGEIGPAPSLITPQSPALFRRIKALDYFKAHVSCKLDGKSCMDQLRIQYAKAQIE
ncbi:hypothetical protein Dimus_033129 [Dionaea muscipula]